MIITITLRTDNAAFEDLGEPQETSRILQVLANQLEHRTELRPDEPITLLDLNGNEVGIFRAKESY